PDRRRSAAVRRAVLSRGDRVSAFRCGVALSLSLGSGPVERPGTGAGGCNSHDEGRRSTSGSSQRWHPAGVPQPGVRRDSGLHRRAGSGVCLRLAEGGIRMAVETTPSPILTNAPQPPQTIGGLEIPKSTILTTVDSVVNWCRKYSLWPMPFATACCGIELM